MPTQKKNYNIYHYDDPVHVPDSKKILIQETTVFLVIFFILFKGVAFFWPEDVNLVQKLLYWILSLPGLLRDYPSVTGALLSFLTWHVTYFNSAVPGVDPPSPLAPTIQRKLSGADYHLDYVFAILIGPLVSCLLYLELV